VQDVFASLLIFLFPLSEITLALVKRSRSGSARSEDRGSMALLWGTIVIAVTLGFLAQAIPAARIPAPGSVLGPVALVLFVGGLVLRWTAILTLGKFFTVDVAIHADHTVVRSGPYRFMRHPSYTGLLLAFLGFGLRFGNWLSLAVMLVPIALAVHNRVAKEEQALLASLGSEYAAYCAETKRYMPNLF